MVAKPESHQIPREVILKEMIISFKRTHYNIDVYEIAIFSEIYCGVFSFAVGIIN